MSGAASLADQLGRFEALAARLGISRIALIHLAGGPIAAARIADVYASGAVTLGEVREMLAEARLTAPARARPQFGVPPGRAANG